MATTFTQDDINAVAQQVLTLIRDSGREFNNNPITFKDPFNVTEEEREGIRIPAIDERIAGQSKTGTLDLEALLTAYGVTHVEDIASDISSSYMKKVADSNLNMNGHDITGVGLQSGHTFAGSQGNSVLMPYINNSALGISESATPETYFMAYAKKLYTQYANNGLVSFTGSISLSGYGYGEISGYVSTYASHVDSNGEPYSYSFKVVFANGKALFIYRVNASNSIYVKQFDTNYDVNGKRTADIDINGCSLLLTKRMQSILGTGAQATSFIVTPYYNTTSSNVSEAITNWLKNLCIDFKNLSTVLALGMPDYSGRHSILVSLYNTVDTDSTTGIPRYGSGIFIPIAENKIYKFQILNYVLTITSVALS